MFAAGSKKQKDLSTKTSNRQEPFPPCVNTKWVDLFILDKINSGPNYYTEICLLQAFDDQIHIRFLNTPAETLKKRHSLWPVALLKWVLNKDWTFFLSSQQFLSCLNLKIFSFQSTTSESPSSWSSTLWCRLWQMYFLIIYFTGSLWCRCRKSPPLCDFRARKADVSVNIWSNKEAEKRWQQTHSSPCVSLETVQRLLTSLISSSSLLSCNTNH